MATDLQIIAAPPKVIVVGHTTPKMSGIEEYLSYRGVEWNTDPIAGDPEAIVEMGGRVCYHSWDNPKGSTRRQYIQNSIIDHNHLSVTRHLWINFIVADLPRSVQLELVRHAVGTAPSFESQRFVDKFLRFVAPPMYRKSVHRMEMFREDCEWVSARYWRELEMLIEDLKTERPDLDGTLRRKRAKEAARHILGNNVGSDGLYSMNAQAIRWVLTMRTDPHADLSIREFAHQLGKAAQPIMPDLMADGIWRDIPNEPPQIIFGSTVK